MLGCIVRLGSSFYILTNQHVIVQPGGRAPSADVYQPKLSTCADIKCNSPTREEPRLFEESKSGLRRNSLR
jgi:hypothetical protein